ncbi:MAG: glycosyltransferase [Betaproteobacteria bacterium]|nr:glycosyltransferase [Betaproteobacteria bacterium]
MRILQVIRSLTFGGAENHVLSLLVGLRDRGHDVLLAAPANSWIGEQCEQSGLLVEYVPMRGIADLRSYWKLHRLIRSWRADIVHAHQVRPAQYVGIAAWSTDAIPICTAHSTGVYKHMRRCRHIIGVSDAVVENLINHRYPKQIITRIYNGVPDVVREERGVLRKELGIPETQYAVVCAGRFHRDKGQDVLIKAINFCPDNVHAYFLGDADNDFGRALRAETLGNPRIHFLGYRNDVQRILPAFDLYAAPSRREAFSLSLAEAEAAQLPIVGSRVGGIPEVVRDGESGILVPPNNIDALVDVIQKLSIDPVWGKRLGREGRLRFVQNFTVDRMIAQTESLYAKLLAAV